MKRWAQQILLLGAALLAFGCDREGRPIEEFGLDKLAKGVSSESDVRMVMGEPETIWEEADGSRALEYPKGPEGVRTWMVIIDRSGKLRDYRQLLTEENFARIKPGLSKDQVRHTLGKPRTVVQYKLKNEEAWDWRYLPSPGTDARLFNTHFDISTGMVTRTSSSDATNN
jgi:outer membrane protein assembly factor BamE (lipoprotein component of BamABCDE complex)